MNWFYVVMLVLIWCLLLEIREHLARINRREDRRDKEKLYGRDARQD